MAFALTAAIISGVGALAGGALSANAASSAASAQAASAKNATALQREMFNKQVELQAPFREAGLTAQNRLMDYLGLSGNTGAAGYGTGAQTFGMSDFQADPGYAFRMSEGLKNLDQTAAARGGLLSGNALRGATEYGQNLASQEYQNAYNRYQTNRASVLNPLQSLLGSAQTASNATGQAAQNFGAQAGNNMLAAGNAQASGYVGQANAWNNAIGGIGNAANTYSLMSRLRTPTPTFDMSTMNTINPYGVG